MDPRAHPARPVFKALREDADPGAVVLEKAEAPPADA